jgi:hypothetical protein
MFTLIDSIKCNSTIEVCGKKFKVMSKALYVTETESQKWYTKIILDGHWILVIAPFDNFIYFGHIQNVFGDGDLFPDNLKYDNNIFEKVAEDYQIMKEIIFGDPLMVEGEVKFADYECGDGGTLISLAVVSRTKERADVIAKILTETDIIVMKEND